MKERSRVLSTDYGVDSLYPHDAMQTAHSPLPRSNFHSSPSNVFCNSRSTKCILTTESLWRTDLVGSCRNTDLSVPSGTVWPASPPWRSQFITQSPVDLEEKTLKGFCLWKNPLFLANWIYIFFPYQCGQYFFHRLPPTFQAQEVCLLGCRLTGGRWFTKQEAITSKVCSGSIGGEARVLDSHYWCWESGEQCWKHSLTYLLWLGKSL